jgi:hypothetical protein
MLHLDYQQDKIRVICPVHLTYCTKIRERAVLGSERLFIEKMAK